MSNQAPKLRVRFHGRFVFVTQRDKETNQNELIVLAANMDQGKEADDPTRHNVFMTVRQQHVVRPVLDERRPSYRLFGGNVVPTLVGKSAPDRVGNIVPYDGANLVWNIAQCDVAVEAGGGFHWVTRDAARGTKFELADLAELAPGKKLAERYLNSVEATPEWATTAIIRLRAGEGRVYHELPAEPPYNKDMQFKFRRPSGEETQPACLADLVEVTIDLPTSIDVKFVREGSIVTLKATDWSAYPGPAADNPCPGIGLSVPDQLPEIQISNDVVLAFSNLCTTSANREVDTEFAKFYQVLVNPPSDRDQFLPYLYPPPEVKRIMGDCYLAAKIDHQP